MTKLLCLQITLTRQQVRRRPYYLKTSTGGSRIYTTQTLFSSITILADVLNRHLPKRVSAMPVKVSSSSQQATVTEHEMCSPGCAAKLMDWTGVYGETIFSRRAHTCYTHCCFGPNGCPNIRL